jgi:hypothetical protein
MAIYRGSGGSTSTTDQATIDQVAEDAATATTKATEAANSATAAATSASSASTSATNAATSATSASTSASNASISAANASTSASSASSSATAAAASATAADASDTNAAAEAAAALESKALALDAQTAAETAESNASDHADDAVKAAYGAVDTLQTLSDTSTIYSARHYASKTGADKTAAAASAAAAATSETNAAASATAAQAAEDAALAALDSFDDRYLGQKASDPTLDNDGNALVAGALYFNTTDNAMKVYDGSAWLAAYASLSGALIAANNLSDLVSASAARTNLGLGTAATTASTDYATAAQGALADSALQDITGESIESLSDVATMTPTDGQLLTWDSVTSKWNAEDAPVSLPDQTGQSGNYLTTNGTSASWDALATVANSGAYSDLSGTPTNVSTFTNDSGYITGNQTITLSGDVSGSGTTSISVTVADDSHNHIISNVDGLQTALDGKQASGDYVVATGDTMTGALNFGDTIKANFGASNDLQIYHDGSSGNSYVLTLNPYLVLDAATSIVCDKLIQPNTGSIDLGHSGAPWRVTYTGTVDLGNWTVTESAGVLYFATGGTNKMKLDASGNLTVVGDVTAYGTI